MIFMIEPSGHDVGLGKDHVSCLSITNRHTAPGTGNRGTWRDPRRGQYLSRRSRIRATRQILLDNSYEIETVCRLWDDTMTIDAATSARFFWCDQRRHENDWHGVHRPIRSELHCY